MSNLSYVTPTPDSPWATYLSQVDRVVPYKPLLDKAIELIENGSPAYRAVYCCKYLDTVFVLHAFEKTTNDVDHKELATAAQRYREMKARVEADTRIARKPKTWSSS